MWHRHGDGGSRGNKNPQSRTFIPYIYPQIDSPIIRWKGIFTLEEEKSEVA